MYIYIYICIRNILSLQLFSKYQARGLRTSSSQSRWYTPRISYAKQPLSNNQIDTALSSRLTFSSFPQFKYCSQHWFSSTTFDIHLFNIPRKKNIPWIQLINFQQQHPLFTLPSFIDVCTHTFLEGWKSFASRKPTSVSRERNYNRTHPSPNS